MLYVYIIIGVIFTLGLILFIYLNNKEKKETKENYELYLKEKDKNDNIIKQLEEQFPINKELIFLSKKVWVCSHKIRVNSYIVKQYNKFGDVYFYIDEPQLKVQYFDNDGILQLISFCDIQRINVYFDSYIKE